jgi:hypothetical protein
MGRQHVKGGKLSMRRQKTNVQFDIPLLSGLLAELELHPKTQLAYLMTGHGKPSRRRDSETGFANNATRRACHNAPRTASGKPLQSDTRSTARRRWNSWRGLAGNDWRSPALH